jgi:putative endonuclease
MTDNTRLKGSGFEKLAEKYLESKGLKGITRNFHCRLGEIDLIMRDQNTLVFVEVRFRARSSFGSAIQTISQSKQKKIIRTAKLFMGKHGLYEKLFCRFDVLGIDVINGENRFNWIADAFSSQDAFQ